MTSLGQNNNLAFSGKIKLVIPAEDKAAVKKILKEKHPFRESNIDANSFIEGRIASLKKEVKRLPKNDLLTVILSVKSEKVPVTTGEETFLSAFLNKLTGKKPEYKIKDWLNLSSRYEPGSESKKLGMKPKTEEMVDDFTVKDLIDKIKEFKETRI